MLDATSRWIDLLAALRAEHLARLHAFSRHVAFGALGLSAVIMLCAVLGLDALWDVSFEDTDLGLELAGLGAAAFFAGCGLIALALRQQRRDRRAAVGALDRAIPQLVAGADPGPVLADLSERMRKLASPRFDAGPGPCLPSELDARWLGTTSYTKVFLGCALLLLASLLVASALVLAVPPDSGDEDYDGGQPTAHAPRTGAEARS